MTRRMDRINVLLRQGISRVISTELKDPRLPEIVSVTRVETSQDLHVAKVFVSVLGDQKEKRMTLKILRSAAGFIRSDIPGYLTLKNLPKISFFIDDSIEKSNEVFELINKANARHETEESL